RAADAVVARRAVLEVLGLLEVGEHLVVRPAGRTVIGPVVEVSPGAPDVDHAVQRARSAEHLAARPGQAGLQGVLLGFGGVGPVFRAVPQLPAMSGSLRLYRPPLGPGDHRSPADPAAGRAGADDDVVELGARTAVSGSHGVLPHAVPPPSPSRARRSGAGGHRWHGTRGLLVTVRP